MKAAQRTDHRYPASVLAILAIFILAWGGTIYLLWRPDSLLLFRWVEALGWMDEIETVRTFVAGAQGPGWLLHSFPHGAWTFSGTILFALLWRRSTKPYAYLWIALIPSFSILGELGQLVRVVPGRFDLLDLLTAFFASGFALMLVFCRHTERHNYTS